MIEKTCKSSVVLQGDDWAPEYRQIHRRARLHGARLPPDALNPRGHYDGRLRPVFSRFTRARKGRDERSGYLALGLPPPGTEAVPYRVVWVRLGVRVRVRVSAWVRVPVCSGGPHTWWPVSVSKRSYLSTVSFRKARPCNVLGPRASRMPSANVARPICVANPGLCWPALATSQSRCGCAPTVAGDPQLAESLSVEAMTWTVDCGEFMVVATPQPAAPQMTLVWTVAEADRCATHKQ